MLESLFAFAGVALVISMVPGPTTVMIMRQSIRSGRRAGIATVLGNETGWLLWGVVAAFGLSALLVASQVAYDGLRVAGAAVLVCWGAKTLLPHFRRTGAVGADGLPEPPRSQESPWRSFRLGLFTNLANPKAGIFAVTLLPQFVPEGAPVLLTLLLLWMLATLIDLLWYSGLVWLIGLAKAFFAQPKVRRRLEQLSAVMLIALGIRLAADAG